MGNEAAGRRRREFGRIELAGGAGTAAAEGADLWMFVYFLLY
jgi:hypothetical protein